ncbi:MAG: hypothetical protein M0005_11600 [Actinomycetota bacterium]|jgi:uncharacterized membrane protein|nr:hypothetical protein [Actinomycetota bacterium]MDA8302155.1 hypothetical protein [Actinomycetota bacterium]
MMVFGPLAMLLGFVVVVLGVVVVLRFVLGSFGANTLGRSSDAANQGARLEAPSAPRDERDPIEIVRERYARGEIDHDELERYLDNLVVDERPGRPGHTPRG